MIRFALAAALGLVVAGPALAGSCPVHMKAVDEAMAKNPSMSATQMAEVKKLRSEGGAMHAAGKHAESMSALAKAKTMLNIK